MPNRRMVAFLCSVPLFVAACSPPPGAEAPLSEAASSAPPPRLGETASFDAALAASGPEAQQLDAGSDALALRAAALRARAAGLSGPVVDPAEAARLAAASG